MDRHIILLIGRVKKIIYARLLKILPKRRVPLGMNIIGLFHSSIGLGQAARYIFRALEKNDKIPVMRADVFFNNGAHHFEKKYYYNKLRLKYTVNLEIYNPDIMLQIRSAFGFTNWFCRYNIGYWVWELDEIPENWVDAVKYIDEIWVPSHFVQENLRRVGIKSKLVPYPVSIPDIEIAFNLSEYNIDQSSFNVLTLFDVLSFIERKNPFFSINAFIKAAGRMRERSNLIIKVNNAHTRPEVLAQLHEYIDACPNIIIVDEIFTESKMNAFISSMDVVLSLHRAEGFGLALAEAMAMGVPVIATAWSGNMEFMTPENSCPVKYKLVELQENIGPYRKGALWAEADINHAADYLIRLSTDTNYYSAISLAGVDTIKNFFTLEKFVDRVASLLST